MSEETFQRQLDKLYREGNHQKIEAFILEKIADVSTSGSSPQLCMVYNELGGYYRGVSRYQDSLSAFDQAAASLKADGLERSVQAATLMINRAGTCRLMGDSAAALDLYQQAGVILGAHPEADRYLVASLANNLSISYMDSGRLEEALVEAQKGYEIVITIARSEQHQAASLVNIAAILFKMDNPEKAEARMDQAIKLFKNLPSPNSHYAAALDLLANIRAYQGDFPGAKKALEEALEYTRFFFGENIEAASTKESLAYVCSALEDTAGAHRWQQSAVEDLERLLGAEDPRTTSARNRLEKILKQV